MQRWDIVQVLCLSLAQQFFSAASDGQGNTLPVGRGPKTILSYAKLQLTPPWSPKRYERRNRNVGMRK